MLFLGTAVGQSTQDSSEAEIALAPLDFTEVTSGLLYEKGFQFFNPNLINGETIIDSNLFEINSFGFAYGTIISMSTDGSLPLPRPEDSYMGYIEGFLGNVNEVNISMLYFNYHKFSPNAINDGLVTWDGERFHDVPGRLYSPYINENILVSTSTVNNWNSLSVNFRLPNDLFFTNQQNQISEIKIDFDDENGFINTSSGSVHSVNYPTDGLKKIKISVERIDGTIHQCHFMIEVEEPINTANLFDPTVTDTLVILPRATPHNGFKEHGGGLVSIFFNCDGKLDKPLIIIDGIDINNSRGSEYLFENILNIEDPIDNTLLLNKILADEGYDLIFIDYSDATDDMRRNARMVEEAIQRINDYVIASGFQPSNIVLAPSMASPVTKFALLEMESLGIEHHVTKLIGLDGAFRGANVPLGLQHAIKHAGRIELGNQILISDLIPMFQKVKNVLNSPAVSQLLLHNANSADEFSPREEYFEFQTEINQLGAPSNFELVTLSCGSLIGENQVIGFGDNMISYDGKYSELINFFADGLSNGIKLFIKVNTFGSKVELKVNAMPNGNGEIYKGFYRIFIFGRRFVRSSSDFYVEDGDGIDSAPGGLTSFLGIDDNTQLPESLEFGPKIVCFIPTPSSLDIEINNNLLSSHSSAGPLVDRFWGSYDDSVTPLFSNMSFDNQHNQNHNPAINRSNIPFFYMELLSNDELFSPNSEFLSGVYNFGKSLDSYNASTTGMFTTRNVIDYNVTVSGSENALWICREGVIGNQNSSTNRNNGVSSFNVFIKRGINCDGDSGPVTVLLGKGGDMILGEWNSQTQKKGNVFVQSDAKVVVDDGSKIEVNHLSIFSIMNAGIVEINNGGLFEARFGGKIIIENGGELIIRRGGTLRISHDSFGKLKMGGKLVIEDGAKIQLWDGSNSGSRSVFYLEGEWQVDGFIDFSGNGYFQVEPSQSLILPNNLIKMNGMGAEYRHFLIKNNASLSIGNGRISMTNVGFAFENNSQIIGDLAGNEMIFYNCHFNGLNEGSSIGLKSIKGDRINVVSSSFRNLYEGMYLSKVDSDPAFPNCFVGGCYFENNLIGINVENSSNVRINNSTFVSSTTGLHGIKASEVNSLRLTNDNISGYVNYQKQPAVWLYNVSECLMNGGILQNNIIGFGCPQPGWANIRLYNQASVSNNSQYGIWIEKGQASPQTGFLGSVTMDCARLENNGVAGIKGEDVYLDIDAYIHSYGNLNYLRSNTFQCAPNGVLFEICYDNYMFRTIAARGNYWGTHHAQVEQIIQSLHRIQSNHIGNGCSGNFPNLMVDVSFKSGVVPTGCPVPPTPPVPGEPGGTLSGSEGKCSEIEVNNLFVEDKTAHASYMEAYSLYQQAVMDDASTESAKSAFSYLSEVSQAERNEASSDCRYFVDVAKLMITVPERQDFGRFEIQGLGMQQGHHRNQQLHLFPNPASDQLNLTGLIGSNIITISDIQGRVIFSQVSTDNELIISLDDYVNGMYFLQVQPMETSSGPDVIYIKFSVTKN